MDGTSENSPRRTPKRIRDYRDLLAWQKARNLVKHVYAATCGFPSEEIFGLRQQLRRAIVSVPSNIAEGNGRGTRKDYARFLQTARGSLYEVQTQLLLAHDLGYLPAERLNEILRETAQCCQLLQGLLRRLRQGKAERRLPKPKPVSGAKP